MENKQEVLKGILAKVKILYIIFGSICIAIFARIIWIQTGTNSDQLRTQAVDYSFRNDVLEATRGNILSDDERILATSIPFYEIRMDMVARGLDSAYFYENVDKLAASLSGFFKDKSAEQYQKGLIEAKRNANAFYRINSRKVNYLELQQIKKFPIFERGQNKGGFIAIESGRRVQPYGKLASRSIGFVNTTGIRVGIEGGFEQYLRGTDGVTMMQKISGNFWIPVSSPTNIEPVNGMDVVTTINIELQDFVQTALGQRLLDVSADWGTVVVMETTTGHVKAIANATRLKTGQIVEDYNYAIGMSMEPGSTFKLAPLLALLDDAGMPIDEIVETGGGRAQIGPVTVVDATRYGYGTQTLQGIFEHSSNIGFAKAINKYYGREPGRYVDFINKLGLGKELGLQIAGEARPVVKHPKNKFGWDGMTLTMMSYGYAVRVTPMQTLTLYNAVANSGVMVKPQFVKELRQHGMTLETYKTDTIIPRIASEKTIRLARQSLEGVITNGTAKSLKNPFYLVGAKTGTAQIAMGNRGYRDNGGRHYLGSIVGYFPADRPQYTIMIAIKTFTRDGSGGVYYGGALSAPLFKAIADQIYHTSYQFVEPITAGNTPQINKLPVKSGDETKLRELLTELRLTPKIDTVGTPVEKSAWDVTGMTFIDAVSKLERQGYRVSAYGRGTVYAQKRDSLEDKIIIYLK